MYVPALRTIPDAYAPRTPEEKTEWVLATQRAIQYVSGRTHVYTCTSLPKYLEETYRVVTYARWGAGFDTREWCSSTKHEFRQAYRVAALRAFLSAVHNTMPISEREGIWKT